MLAHATTTSILPDLVDNEVKYVEEREEDQDKPQRAEIIEKQVVLKSKLLEVLIDWVASICV